MGDVSRLGCRRERVGVGIFTHVNLGETIYSAIYTMSLQRVFTRKTLSVYSPTRRTISTNPVLASWKWDLSRSNCRCSPSDSLAGFSSTAWTWGDLDSRDYVHALQALSGRLTSLVVANDVLIKVLHNALSHARRRGTGPRINSSIISCAGLLTRQPWRGRGIYLTSIYVRCSGM